MSLKPLIHLCIPQLLQPLTVWKHDFAFEPQTPVFSQLLSQFEISQNSPLPSVAANLFRAVDQHSGAQPAIAQYRASVQQLDASLIQTGLLCADPVHLEVGMKDITLTQTIDDLSDSEADEMLAALNQHFQQDGLQFVRGSNRHWYVCFDEKGTNPEDIKTTPLDDVLGKNIANLLPQSNHINWQVIQNEAQMILHASAVNQQREMAGLASVNSLWFWGGGEGASSAEMEKQHTGETQMIYCNDDEDAILRAHMLAKAGGCDWCLIPDGFPSGITFSQNKTLVLLNQLNDLALYDQLELYQKALEDIEQTIIQPLYTAWQAGKLALIIDSGDGKIIRPKKAAAWKFWRQSPTSLLDIASL